MTLCPSTLSRTFLPSGVRVFFYSFILFLLSLFLRYTGKTRLPRAIFIPFFFRRRRRRRPFASLLSLRQRETSGGWNAKSRMLPIGTEEQKPSKMAAYGRFSEPRGWRDSVFAGWGEEKKKRKKKRTLVVISRGDVKKNLLGPRSFGSPD